MQVIRWCLKAQKPDIVGTMNTMTTTDLKPGIVRHPEYGYALAFEGAHNMLIAGLLLCDPHDVTTIGEDDAEFGARITLTLKDGASERWLRTGIHNPWQCYLGDGEMIYSHWDELIERGTVSLGWGDES